ncbi:MAG: hypothetical protein IJC21_04125 [Lentisphaeria bacterium]|nr:hypothetical protein [Lentisphaeria bacterium]
MKHIFLLAAAAIVTLSGCISYDYDGKELDTPSNTVQICTDENRINKADYSVLGKACASGNSMNISRDDLYEKLSSKAKECGADIVLITSYQVVPTGSGHSTVNASFDHGDSNASWQQIGRDVDANYGNIRGISAESSSSGSYRRIINAEYLKLKPKSVK